MGLNSYSSWTRSVLKRQGFNYHVPPPHKHAKWAKWIILAMIIAAAVIDILLWRAF